MVPDILCVNVNPLRIGFVAPEKEAAKDDAVAARFDFRLRPVEGSRKASMDGIPANRKDPSIVSEKYVGAAQGCTPVHRPAQPQQLVILSNGDNELWVKETGGCKWYSWKKDVDC